MKKNTLSKATGSTCWGEPQLINPTASKTTEDMLNEGKYLEALRKKEASGDIDITACIERAKTQAFANWKEGPLPCEFLLFQIPNNSEPCSYTFASFINKDNYKPNKTLRDEIVDKIKSNPLTEYINFINSNCVIVDHKGSRYLMVNYPKDFIDPNPETFIPNPNLFKKGTPPVVMVRTEPFQISAHITQ